VKRKKVVSFLGEYDCRLDAKGRIKLPAGLIRQFPSADDDSFVMNRGFENHLMLYPKKEWDKIVKVIDSLNSYDRKTREFRRFFYRGACLLTLDTNKRLLMPKKLLDWANIENDIVLFAHTNIIEVWNKEAYEGLLEKEPDDFAELAEIVLGTKNHDIAND
jgi:MraZ protein